jgi:putative ABC transport system permease protein
MFIQLILIGFVLTFIFNTQNLYFISLILFVMLISASWIALTPIGKERKTYLSKALFSLSTVGLSVLALIIFVIIKPDPWYKPAYLIPLTGMIFSNSMNVMSVAAERFIKEMREDKAYEIARNDALKAAMIPLTNSFFAVGLVSLPGMMTGQILAGADPLIAVRYQILVMTSLYGAAGLSTSLFLFNLRPKSRKIN